MTRKERHRLEMLQRVRDFGAAHVALFPESSEGAQAFAAVTAAAEAINTNAVKKLLTAKDGQEALVAARQVVIDQMRVIAGTAKAIPRLVTSDPKFRVPDRKADTTLITAARTFIADAQTDRDRLIRLGMPATTIPDLADAVAALDKAVAERAEGRAQAKGAQTAIKDAIVGGIAAVRTLDVVVINAIRQDAALVAEWKQHRRIADVRSSSPGREAPANDAAQKAS